MTDLHTRGRPTMSDVALAAGVSIKTVSRVVNGGDQVSASKFARVSAAIQELGFRRNESARQLRQGTAGTIGLLVDDLANPFNSSLTRAVEDVALSHGRMLLAASSAEDSGRARQTIEALAGRGVDGFIITPSDGIDADFLSCELAAGSSLVFVDRPVRGVPADTVLVDNRGGAETGTAHLIAHGHRRIAFFGDARSVYTSDERRQGYLDALHAAAIPVDEAIMVSESPSASGASALIDAVLASPDGPTAVFSGNNRWSVIIIRSLHRARDRGSIALVGFDDFELGDVLEPGITVLAQDPAAIGRIATDLLFRRIAGDDSPPQRVELGVPLIERGSGEVPGPFSL